MIGLELERRRRTNDRRERKKNRLQNPPSILLARSLSSPYTTPFKKITSSSRPRGWLRGLEAERRGRKRAANGGVGARSRRGRRCAQTFVRSLQKRFAFVLSLPAAPALELRLPREPEREPSAAPRRRAPRRRPTPRAPFLLCFAWLFFLSFLSGRRKGGLEEKRKKQRK